MWLFLLILQIKLCPKPRLKYVPGKVPKPRASKVGIGKATFVEIQCLPHTLFLAITFGHSQFDLFDSKGKGGYPWESTPTMYTTMYPIYMAYIGQYEGIPRKQLVVHSLKGTHIFPLIDSPETFSVI